MQPDRPVGDRQAQSSPARLAVAGVVEPVKGLKNPLQRLVRNARTRVEHANHDLFATSRIRCRSSRTSTVVPSAV